MKRKYIPLQEFASYGSAGVTIFKRAKELRKRMTEAEKILWALVRRNTVRKYKFRRQHPFNNYIIDFFCSSLMLAVEIDGGYHFTPEQTEKDKYREEILHRLDVTIIRFTNEEVIHETDQVMESIIKKVKELEIKKRKKKNVF
ncbi:MAG: endonuclease domain-containing protein [Bacteroidota bacterium]